MSFKFMKYSYSVQLKLCHSTLFKRKEDFSRSKILDSFKMSTIIGRVSLICVIVVYAGMDVFSAVVIFITSSPYLGYCGKCDRRILFSQQFGKHLVWITWLLNHANKYHENESETDFVLLKSLCLKMAERNPRHSRRGRRKFNLAVIGRSNSGKSSLIKALLKAQFGTAIDTLPKTDALECTSDIEKFEQPGSRIVLWDVPGCGTQDEKLDGYDKRIDMDKYDGFIVCCGGPVTEYELSLNNLIAGKGRRYIFVRTKVDTAIENDKKAHPSSFNEGDALKRLRQGIVEKLSESGVSEFLVSNNYPDKFDLATLIFIIFDESSLAAYMESSNRKVKKEKRGK